MNELLISICHDAQAFNYWATEGPDENDIIN
jgi:hypothetical protein